MAAPQPLYTTVDSVKIRLSSKVQFESVDGLQDGELPNALLLQLIFDAETEVEQDLRQRYKIPFQSCRTGKWMDLPDHSKRAIRQIIDQMCVMNILATDFGRGSHVDGSKYYEELKDKYDAMLDKLLGHGKEGANDKIDRYRHSPPLDDVALAPSNSKADDGYRGTIINTDMSEHDSASYAAEQVDNPAIGWLGRGLIGRK